jgi:hypothetical protein
MGMEWAIFNSKPDILQELLAADVYKLAKKGGSEVEGVLRACVAKDSIESLKMLASFEVPMVVGGASLREYAIGKSAPRCEEWLKEGPVVSSRKGFAGR